MRVTPLSRLSFALAFFLLAPSLAFAATDVAGDIAADTRWTADGSPYIVNFPNDVYSPHFLTVAPSATLTIDPGVVVKLNAYNGIAVQGALIAEGTVANPIIFTSLKDDSVAGDTNGDGGDTAPADEQWMHIEFQSGSRGSLDHAVVRYGGLWQPVLMTGIANYGGALVIDHTTLAHNGYDGLGQYGGHTTLTHSDISNQQVGISVSGGELEIRDTRIHDNSMSGIHHTFEGVLSITHSEIDHNGAGIVAEYRGSVDVSDSSIHDNATASSSLGIDNKTQIIDYDENDNPYVSDPGISINARNNWWGSANGPLDLASNPAGAGNGVAGDVAYLPWLLSDPLAPPDPCAAPGACVSNIFFLPGVEASRLYRPDYNAGTDQLWEPNADSDARDLVLDPSGASIRGDVYTKDVIDEVNVLPVLQKNIYKSFLNDLRAWKRTDHLIADYAVIPYDWRFSPDEILNSGRQFPDGRIYYSGDLAATSTPYIIQELRRLAASSKTGKVTIVAHSNGGLLAKALTNKLGQEASRLIDKIIFVAVPQAGTPQAVGAILHGYDQGLPYDFLPLVLTPEVARTLAENMPSAYDLLPSADYFTHVDNPAVAFDNSSFLAEFRARYGQTIHDAAQLKHFITDSWRLASSSPSDLQYPSVGNAALLSRAETFHEVSDVWTPPQGVSLYEVAGWGEDTLATIEYKEGKKAYCGNLSDPHTCTVSPAIVYYPKEVVEGDGTVLVPSALWTPGAERYWVNLRKHNNNFPRSASYFDRKHADILEVPSLRTLVQNILTNATATLPEFITTTQPVADQSDGRLHFLLHSPLNLSATDNLGNVVSSATSTIPGGRWKRYGEVQSLTVPENTPITLALDGYASGSFTLDMEEVDGNGGVTASSTLSAIPSSADTRATMSLADGTLANASPLLVDYDGNGTADFSLKPEIGKEVVFDITPPEAIIALDPVSRELAIHGVDNLSPTAVLTTATSSLITDEAGNTLHIIFKKLAQEEDELKLEIQELRYNGIPAGKVSKTVLQYEWSADRTGKLKELEEKAIADSATVEGHYSTKKNITKLEQKMKGGKENKKTLPGLVVIGLATDKGKIEVNY